VEQSEAEKIVQKMQEMFGDKLVDPDVFPRQFEFQVKLAKFEMKVQNERK
jgi:hypothetical protein